MSGSNSDRNLLFGILALQMDFISRDALIAAMGAWVLDKAKPLGQILAEQGHLNPQHLALLEQLVQAHIEAHHNDPQQSLAALSSVSSVRDELAAISDDQLQKSLHAVGGATQQARIDGICDSFEEAWMRANSVGERPTIEDYLGELSGPERAFLLCELAALDFDYRRLAGETPSVADYCVLFPDLDAARLARLLARHGPVDPHATKFVEDTSRPGQGLRYRILRPHARGGLGEVFVALDQELHREVALKEIQEERAHDTVSRNRFLLEAEITGGLEHPGIVPVYGLGQYSDGRPFYAMRFIKGDNLKEAIRRFHEAEKPGRDPGERSLALRDLLRRFVDVCNAVAYAHSRGVLHRDLKPGNIMLGKYGETLIVDWGLAKTVGRSDQTRTGEESTLQPSSGSDWAATVMGTVIGTPAYMSPEQAAGRLDLLGPASDIYSLGATLYALLTGTPPFDESDKVELLQEVQRGTWRSPRQVKPQTPPALDAICRKAMALEPKDRYATALELAADVEHWLADEPVSAYREPWSQRTARWLRRHRPLVAGAAAVLLAAVPLLLVIAVNREQARRQAETDKFEIARKADIALANYKEAFEREAETEAVLEFVGNRVLAAGRPEGQDGGLGNAVTLRRAVEAALPFVAQSFTNQPLIEARLRLALATSFAYLGDAKTAAQQYEAACALYAHHLGPDYLYNFTIKRNIGAFHFALQRHADVLKFHEETLALRKAKLGPDHPETLKSLSEVAQILIDLDRGPEAVTVIDDGLKRARLLTLARLMEYGAPITVPITGKFGHSSLFHYLIYLRMRYFEKIKDPFGCRRTAEMWEEWNPTDFGGLYEAACWRARTSAVFRAADPSPSGAKQADAEADQAMAWLKKFAAAYKDAAVSLRVSLYRDKDLDTLREREDFKKLWAELAADATKEALKASETLTLMKAKFGTDHPETLRSMIALAETYAFLGRHEDAVKLLGETLALQKTKLGPDHPDTLYSMGRMAEQLVKLDRGSEAVPVIDDCVRREIGKNVHPQLLSRMILLRLRHFEKMKDPVGCRRTAEMWEELNRTDAGSLYDAACIRAVTAAVLTGTDQADAEAERAMAWLKKAVAAGWKNAAHMLKDKDLDALRDREDFKKLLAELAAGAAKEK
jgi:serine/threonine protein kinase